ncbi:hypothetical protein [Pseudomonas citronellolis]|uniref:hypothetical protein n=1 Tax=Pseudomonas citronellolis TaxID=53408 RepID=UPI0023E46FD4|nr:hypothetical protein [Pseudomonas citronellolis]MDF3932390.1 hypothetical protein [Pseudomonas citronellolis]
MRISQSLKHPFGFVAASSLALGCATFQASAVELYNDGKSTLNGNLLAAFGALRSQRNYYEPDGGSTWREGFLKYGVDGQYRLDNGSSLGGAFAFVSSGVWGDGDATGLTDGSERTTKIEDANLAWRSGTLFEALGENGVELSGGRQRIVVGDGFLINGDDVNAGKAFAGGEFNRGGVYYMGARHAFDQTAVLRLGGAQGWRGDAIWLKSDNRFQGNSELAIGTLEHVAPEQTLGLTYIHVQDVDKRYTDVANPLASQRDGMNVYSLRGVRAGLLENLTLAFEYAYEDRRRDSENAWYGEASYAFADTPWQPTLSYRYSRFSEGYDALFFGFNRGYGTWVQGEVAGNFAGPYNNNAVIQHLGLKLRPREDLTLGALFFDFSTLHRHGTFDLDGQELDLYADWAATSYLQVTPVLGLYDPQKSFAQGGSQAEDNDLNLFTALQFAVHF